jgi:hypothetical protein
MAFHGVECDKNIFRWLSTAWNTIKTFLDGFPHRGMQLKHFRMAFHGVECDKNIFRWLSTAWNAIKTFLDGFPQHGIR